MKGYVERRKVARIIAVIKCQKVIKGFLTRRKINYVKESIIKL